MQASVIELLMELTSSHVSTGVQVLRAIRLLRIFKFVSEDIWDKLKDFGRGMASGSGVIGRYGFAFGAALGAT